MVDFYAEIDIERYVTQQLIFFGNIPISDMESSWSWLHIYFKRSLPNLANLSGFFTCAT